MKKQTLKKDTETVTVVEFDHPWEGTVVRLTVEIDGEKASYPCRYTSLDEAVAKMKADGYEVCE